jgi:hypothetical protein
MEEVVNSGDGLMRVAGRGGEKWMVSSFSIC